VGRELQPGLGPPGDDGWRAVAARAESGITGEDVVRTQPAICQRAHGGPPATRPPPVVDCLTVALVPQVKTGLQNLQNRTNLSPTDIVNRAVTLYEFIEAQLSAGRELLIRDERTGEIRRVLIT
jgi:hypothetical protein